MNDFGLVQLIWIKRLVSETARINTLIETVLPKDNKIMLNLTKGNVRSRNIQKQQEVRLKNVTPAVSLLMEEDIFI